MSLLAPALGRNVSFRHANQQKRNPFLSLRSIPILIFLASGLTIQPAPAASPILDVIPLAAPALPAIEGIAASTNGDNVYVAVFENSSIAVINTATNLVTSIIPTTAPPLSVAVSADGGTLYVTDQGASLEVFALPTGDPLFTIPLNGGGGIPAGSPNGKMVYVPVDNGTVVALDYIGNTAIINTGGSPTQVVFNSASTKAYVSDSNNPVVYVIDTTTNGVSTITTSAPANGLAIHNTTLYAPSNSGEVFVINTKTAKVSSTITVKNPVDTEFGFPAVTPDGGFLYVPVIEFNGGDFNGQSLVVINTATKKVDGKPIVVGDVPFQIVTAGDGFVGYLTTALFGAVDVIQLQKASGTL